MIRIITLVSIALLYFWPISVAFNFFFNQKSRAEKISYLRSFKKGKCAIVYISAVPLYCLGRVYSGQNLFSAVFDSINDIIGLVVLKYETANISALMEADSLYTFAIYSAFVLVGINAIVFAISLLSQHVWCAYQVFVAKKKRGDKLFIFGNNPQSISIYKSDKKRNKLIIDDIQDTEAEKLYMDKIAFYSTPDPKDFISDLFLRANKSERESILVINTLNDEENIKIARLVIDEIKSIEDNKRAELFLKIKVFVFGSPEYEAIYEDIASDALGVIRFVNKYRTVAIDFIDNHPFSRFLDEEEIDYETSLLKKDIDLNVLFIGFGKTNRQLFLTSVSNNQFITEGEGDPELKRVNYFIFDKIPSENDKNLNHSYYRFSRELKGMKEEDYLPLPSLPANEAYYHLDINDGEFYERIKEITKKEKSRSFIIISFGTDLENIDLARRLVEKKKEWSLEKLEIFVKARKWKKEDTPLSSESCFFFGNDEEVVFNIEKILFDKMTDMAQKRNEVYDLEYAVTHGESITLDEKFVKDNHDASYKNWYVKRSEMERESSLYSVLSLRSKLNLMGLDYEEGGEKDDDALSEDEYLSVYAKGDMPDTEKYTTRVNGKKIVDYTLSFPLSRRRNLAVHEHMRWNSFMLSHGIIPSTKKEIESETTVDKNGKARFTNGKNYSLRRHGNLTTFEGLVEFRRIVAERDKIGEEEADVIKYDYQLLDDAYWLLSSNGYKIVKIKNEQN